MTTEKKARAGPKRLTPQNVLRPDAFCKRMGISKNLYYTMVRKGESKVIRLGSRTVFVPISEALRLEGRLPEEVN
jgi:hypothetical protein